MGPLRKGLVSSSIFEFRVSDQGPLLSGSTLRTAALHWQCGCDHCTQGAAAVLSASPSWQLWDWEHTPRQILKMGVPAHLWPHRVAKRQHSR